MSPLGVVLLIVLLLFVVGGLPHWGYWGPNGHGYDYWPSGGLGLVLIVVLVLALMGRV